MRQAPRAWSTAFACAFALAVASPGAAFAQDASAVQAQLDALQRQLDAVKTQIDQLNAQRAAAAALPPRAPAAAPVAPGGGPVVGVKPGDPFTLQFGREEVTLYGNLDLSYDTTTKGLQPFYASSGDSPLGNMGYLGAISSNLSYIGVRGTHRLGPLSGFVYQLETQLDISSTAGTPNTNSSSDSVVKGALTSRNSFVGIASRFGALKIGKTDAPYKNSTARMNPFSAELGDYSVIMGNTGGDNRVEFGTRLDHSIWYESPVMGGFSFNLLASPGQNRASDNSNIAAGESSCAGGNIPGSGALPPACNDGSFGTAYSANVQYQMGRVYATAAYEMHKNVNRTSDLPNLDPTDVADEQAFKYGVQFGLGRRTTVDAVFEDMRRFVSPALQFQNERTRTGHWLALTQVLSPSSNINFGWAHANPTPGDPGQHNTAGGANPDNQANMFTAAFKHTVDRHVSWYLDYAMTLNHPDAHYDLGAGGRGITTDCHDASQLAAFDPTTGAVTGTGPHCYAGGQLRGFSAGIDLRF